MKKTTNFLAPMTGRLLSITKVPDEVFSDRVMGDGFAIDLNGGDVVAPMDATVMSVFPTGHAIMLTGDDGINVLLHIGLETHKFGKEVYHVLVTAGQRVKAGDILVKVDYKKIKRKSTSVVSPIVFMNHESVVLLKDNQMVNAGDNQIIEITYGGTNENN